MVEVDYSRIIHPDKILFSNFTDWSQISDNVAGQSLDETAQGKYAH